MAHKMTFNNPLLVLNMLIDLVLGQITKQMIEFWSFCFYVLGSRKIQQDLESRALC
jgi:hypothetical protein